MEKQKMIRKRNNDDFVYLKISKILIDELKSHCCKNGYQTLQNCLEDLIITKITIDNDE